MNAKIGQDIKLSFDGTINCIACDRVTKKSFGGGFCYPCFGMRRNPANASSVPELCRAHEGEARDMAWAEETLPRRANCLSREELCYQSGHHARVTNAYPLDRPGCDRCHRVCSRAQSLYTAGLVEVAMKEHLTDRTNWQRMLKNEVIDADLVETKASLDGHA